MLNPSLTIKSQKARNKKRQEIKRPDAQAGKTPEFPCYRVQTARAPQWTQLWAKGQWLQRHQNGPAMTPQSTSPGYPASPFPIFLKFPVLKYSYHTPAAKSTKPDGNFRTPFNSFHLRAVSIQKDWFDSQVIPDELCGMGWPKSRDQVLIILVPNDCERICNGKNAKEYNKLRWNDVIIVIAITVFFISCKSWWASIIIMIKFLAIQWLSLQPLFFP